MCQNEMTEGESTCLCEPVCVCTCVCGRVDGSLYKGRRINVCVIRPTYPTMVANIAVMIGQYVMKLCAGHATWWCPASRQVSDV